MSLAQTKPADAMLVIVGLAKNYAAARAVVSKRLSAYQEELAKLQKLHFPKITDAACAASGEKETLKSEITAHPELFEKPRTMTFFGIKLGYQKGKGIIDWADDEKLSDRIVKNHPDLYEVLVKTTHKPQAKALQTLSVADLRKLGCEVEETGDFVFIKAADSAIDKLVSKLLDEGSQPEEA